MNTIERKISTRCGKTVCEFYDEHNKTSKCSEYDDRRDCALSMRQRSHGVNISRRRPETFNW